MAYRFFVGTATNPMSGSLKKAKAAGYRATERNKQKKAEQSTTLYGPPTISLRNQTQMRSMDNVFDLVKPGMTFPSKSDFMQVARQTTAFTTGGRAWPFQTNNKMNCRTRCTHQHGPKATVGEIKAKVVFEEEHTNSEGVNEMVEHPQGVWKVYGAVKCDPPHRISSLKKAPVHNSSKKLATQPSKAAVAKTRAPNDAVPISISALVPVVAKGHSSQFIMQVTMGEVKRSIIDYVLDPTPSFLQRLRTATIEHIVGSSDSNVAKFSSFVSKCNALGDIIETEWMNKAEYGMVIEAQAKKNHDAQQTASFNDTGIAKVPFDAKTIEYPPEFDGADDGTAFLKRWAVVTQVGLDVGPRCDAIWEFDGAHSKENQFQGTYYNCVGLNAEHNTVVVSRGWDMRSESYDSWKPFLSFTSKNAPFVNTDDSIIIADQDKGFARASGEALPNACKKACTNHRYGNVKKQTSGNDSNIWFAMKNATTTGMLEELRTQLSPHGLAYVSKMSDDMQFPICGANTHGRTTSNTAESDNNTMVKTGARLMDPCAGFKVAREDSIVKHNKFLRKYQSDGYTTAAGKGEQTSWMKTYVSDNSLAANLYSVELIDGANVAKVRRSDTSASFEEVTLVDPGDSAYEDGGMNIHCSCKGDVVDQRPCMCIIASMGNFGIDQFDEDQLHARDLKASTVKQYKGLQPLDQVTGDGLVADNNARLPTLCLPRRGRKKKNKRHRSSLEVASSIRHHLSTSSSSSADALGRGKRQRRKVTKLDW